MKKYLFFFFILALLLISPYTAGKLMAQPPPPPTEQIPLDGGLTALVVAGIAYGARKIYKSSRKKD